MRDYKSCSDPKLIEMAQCGDYQAFDTLLGRYVKSAEIWAYSYLKNDDAKDVASEALLNARRYIASLREGTKFSAWLRTIVAREAVDAINLRRNRNEIPMDEANERQIYDREIDDKLPHIIIERKEEAERLKVAISSLSEELQIIIRLRFYEGHSWPDIGRLLGENGHTLQMRARRALHGLGNDLIDILGENQHG